MNKSFKFSLLIMATVCLFTSSVFSQFTRDDATNLVLNTILADDIGKVDVYASYNSVNGNVEQIDNETIDCAYTGNWVFFVDDKPFSGWYHDCRYIFVNDQSGDYSIVTGNIYPKDQSAGYELISEADKNEPTDPGEATGTLNDGLPPNDHYFAVIVCLHDTQKDWNDVSLIYNTLIDIYGYKKENIFVHYGKYGTSGTTYGGDLDGDGNADDLDYSAFGSEVHATFNELAGNTTQNDDIPALENDDQLAVFFTNAYVYAPIPEVVLWAFWNDQGGGIYADVEDPAEIAGIVADISCAQMTLTFSINSGVGIAEYFMDYSNPVQCENRFVHAAASIMEDKHYEQYITGNLYGEYFYYWAAAARGVYPEVNTPWVSSEFETGTFPFSTISGLENHPGDFDPDADGDGYVQMEEAFYYANSMDTWSDDGYYYNPWTPGVEETPADWDLIPFEDDVMTLAGYAGLVETPVTLSGSYLIGGTLSTGPFGVGEAVTFDDGSNIFLINPEAKITINTNSKITLNEDVSVKGTNENNVIEVYGRLFTPYGNVTFSSLSGSKWKGIEFNNSGSSSGYFYLHQGIFSNCNITGEIFNLELNNNILTNGLIDCSNGYVSVGSSYFYNSGIKLNHPHYSNFSVSLIDNVFDGQNQYTEPAIEITKYGSFNIRGNSIKHYNDGLKIYYAGNGEGEQKIWHNSIWDNTGTAMIIYNTTADLTGNNIANSNAGIMMFNRSNISLHGWKDASLPGETQNIHDCNKNEIYASDGSFPHTFEWNAIWDDDNYNDQLVYTTGQEGPFDVRNNYWGDSFEPDEDFFPPDGYIYEPIWELDNGGSETEEDKTLFTNAMTDINDSNYVSAKSKLQQLILNYPNSKYALASLKEIYNIQEFINTDYLSLKQYYNTDATIQNNMKLAELADFLANRCNIKLANWPDAISWFENVIQNPESMEDSIFAIIDLGYTYWLMQNGGLKSSNYVGSMTQYKFADYNAYAENRDYLLSLLPGDQSNLTEQMKQNVNALNGGELLQNIPNPFGAETQIFYKLDNDAVVSVNIFDYTGKLIKTYNEGEKSAGVHSVTFDAGGLTPGMYFYSIDVNGVRSDSKKMIVE